MNRFIVAIAACVIISAAAQAQVRQSGTVTPGHIAGWAANGVVSDASNLTNGGLTSVPIVATGTPLVVRDAATTSLTGYHELAIGANSLGGGLISYNAYGGAASLPMQLNINGSTFTLPGSASCLACGTMAGQNANAVAITGGTISTLTSLGVGTAQTSYGQLSQVTSTYPSLNTSSDIFRVQVGTIIPTDEVGGGNTNANTSTIAITGALQIPNGSFSGITSYPDAAIAGFAISDNLSKSAVGIFSNAGITRAGSSSTGGYAYGANFSVVNCRLYASSCTGTTGLDFHTMYGLEVDVNMYDPASGSLSGQAAGVIVISNSTGTTTGDYSAYTISKTPGADYQPWSNAYATNTGAALIALAVAPLADTTGSDSQPIQLVSIDGSDDAQLTRLYGDNGGLVVRSGANAGFTVLGQDGSSSLFTVEGVASAAPTNFVRVTANTTGTGPVIAVSNGSVDSNPDLSLAAKGTGDIVLNSGSGTGFRVDGVANSDRFLTTTPAASSGNVTLGATMSAGLTITPTVTLSSVSTGTNAYTLCLSAGGVVLLEAAPCTISSRRFKHDVSTLNDNEALPKLMAMRPVAFNMNNPEHITNVNFTNRQIGLIAEDVADIDPRLTVWEPDGVTPKSYRSEAVLALTIKAVQELKAENDNLRKELNELKRRFN